MKSIRMSDETWKTLMRWRLELDVKTIDDVLVRLIKLAPTYIKEIKK